MRPGSWGAGLSPGLAAPAPPRALTPTYCVLGLVVGKAWRKSSLGGVLGGRQGWEGRLSSGTEQCNTVKKMSSDYSLAKGFCTQNRGHESYTSTLLLLWSFCFFTQEKNFGILFFGTRESLKVFGGKAITGYYLCCKGINLAAEWKLNLRRVQERGCKVEARTSVRRLMLQSRHTATSTDVK